MILIVLISFFLFVVVLVVVLLVVVVVPTRNPAVEDQAIDRVHRIGQNNDVVVTRFTIANTVEQQMLEMQV